MAIVSPALADANTGNWHTAARWQRLLAPHVSRVSVTLAWEGGDDDVLLALHARRSAPSIERFAATGRPQAVVLTGTDLYRDLAAGDGTAEHALQCASRVVALQPQALARLAPEVRAKARVVLQSAPDLRRLSPRLAHTFVAVGHLRAEKDPLTLMQAARQLPAPWCLLHIGRALDPALAEAARAAMARNGARYRWLGERRLALARGWIARAQALVHPSRMEGGAQAVIEAVRAGVPVLASRIDGNVGLLGQDYEGYARPGDAGALAALMQRFAADAGFAARLAAQCAARAPLFTPEAEAAALRDLLSDMVQPWAATMPHG